MARPKKLSNTEMAIAATYVIQKLGRPKFGEIAEVLRSPLGIDVNSGTQLRDVLKSLKARDIVSINKDADTDGTQYDYYSLKSIKFASMPEAAHIKDLLPKLLEDDGARQLKSKLDGMEVEPDSDEVDEKKSKARRAKYTDSHQYSAVFELQERIYGGRMINPSLQFLIDKSDHKVKLDARKKDQPTINLFFDRAADGAILIHCAAVRGWFSSALPRLTPHSESVGQNHCGFDEVKIYPQGGVHMTTLPVMPKDFRQSGGVPQTHETLMPGELIMVRFWAPTRGFMTPDEMKAYIAWLGQHAQRHLSPARGSETGKMKLLTFVDHGDVWKDVMTTGKTPEDMDREVELAGENILVSGAKTKGRGNGRSSAQA
jgi:hypothetical protein